MADIEITLNANPLKNLLIRLDKTVKNTSGLMRKTSILMLQNVYKHFNDQKSSDGPWNPPKHREGKALMDTGHLRQSLFPSSAISEAKVSSNVKYAAIHNFGGTIPQRTVRPKNVLALSWEKDGVRYFSKGHVIPETDIPKREFLWLDNEFYDKTKDLIIKEIERVASG